jgi:hypothetical protein
MAASNGQLTEIAIAGWTIHWKTRNPTGTPITRYCLVAIADSADAIAAASVEIGGTPDLELGGALSAEQLAQRNVQPGEMLVLGRSMKSRASAAPRRTKSPPVC